MKNLISALAVAKLPVRGLRQGSAQWLRPELRVRVGHLKAKGVLRHATVKRSLRISLGSLPTRGWLVSGISSVNARCRDAISRTGAALPSLAGHTGTAPAGAAEGMERYGVTTR